jgi:Family of unknown function (DUF6448)
MNKNKLFGTLIVLAASMASVFFEPAKVFGHCDGVDGPVVSAAQKALASGNVNLVLIWVTKKDEGEIRAAFQKTLAVRKLNPQARELADMYFFETLVRLHRAAEGESYTGLKPPGRDLGMVIPAADKALESGRVELLLGVLSAAVETSVRKKFSEAAAKKNFKTDDVDGGREYVEAYVNLLESVERIYEAAKYPARGHAEESRKAESHKEEKP